MPTKHQQLYAEYHGHRKLQKRVIDEHNFTYRNLLKILKPYICAQPLRVLDIGSGVGTLSFYLASLGHKITGIDTSKEAVRMAKANSALFGLEKSIQFSVHTFPKVSIKGTYDLILLSEVIEHIPEENAALQQIATLLNPGGLLVITTPSENAPLYKLGVLKQFDAEVGHVRRYTVEKLLSLMQKHKLTVLQSGKQEGIVRNFLFTNPIAGKLLRGVRGWIADVVSWVDEVSLDFFGESDVYVVAQKNAQTRTLPKKKSRLNKRK